VSASALTSIASPHWYKCTQVNTTLRPLASPQGDAAPRLGTPEKDKETVSIKI
jgi:hypothetical protein